MYSASPNGFGVVSTIHFFLKQYNNDRKPSPVSTGGRNIAREMDEVHSGTP